MHACPAKIVRKVVPVVAILIVKVLRWRVLPDDSCQLLAVFTHIPGEVFQAPPVNSNTPVLSHTLCTHTGVLHLESIHASLYQYYSCRLDHIV